MTQDFAKRKNAAPEPAPARGGNITWFLMGLSIGVFGSFLFYLWQFVPEDQAVAADKPTSDVIADKQVLEIDYDFYDLFPTAEVPIVEEYDQQGNKVQAPENYAYLLQAGSFKSRDDADRLRAELILQGHEAVIREVEQASGTWHRVIVGPYDNERDLTRARNSLAEANIESIKLRVKR